MTYSIDIDAVAALVIGRALDIDAVAALVLSLYYLHNAVWVETSVDLRFGYEKEINL